MDLSFMSIMDFIATYFFDGSTTLAGLAILVIAWIISAVVLMNLKAPPTYSVVPMIPISIFMSDYGIFTETFMVLVLIVSGAPVASVLKKVVS